MDLSKFILANLDAILKEWDAFASTIAPESDRSRLRDDAEAILRTIAADMDTSQSGWEQSEKSKGRGPSHGKDTPAEVHAADRLRLGFDQAQMVSEYRALRASVIRLWLDSSPQIDHAAMDQLIRFNEAIDQALSESVARFMRDIEKSRDFAVAVLAHDLRNPLNSIISSAQYLQRIDVNDRPSGEYLTSIIDSGMRMGKLIENLRDFARTRLGQSLPLNRGLIDLAVICQQTVEEFRTAYPERKIQFSWSGNLQGSGDGVRMNQMLSNLIANAIQHGDQTGRVSVEAHAQSPEALIRVHNEGFADELASRSKIFDSRLRETHTELIHEPAHLGIGLFVALKIIEAHGGTLDFTTAPEAGTTFEVRLPLVDVADDPTSRTN